ncbi:MAG: OsmC family protein [Bacteroidetes bacterium]|nr:OsmC family protein [Bacteroidota bacterium]
MHIELNRLEAPFHFEAVNDTGNTIHFDGSPEIGGQNKGVRPMQSLLMALGGCSGIDVVSILQKQKQEIESFRISIDGQRQKGAEPSLYENIHVVYHLGGPIDPAKAKRAVELSMEKYCSVAKTLEKTATITWEVELNNTRLA